MTGALNESFVESARNAIALHGGIPALASLGWWDLLKHLDDLESRLGVLSVFRAQGRELCCSPALGFLMATPYIAGAGRPDVEPYSTAMALHRDSRHRGRVWVLVGAPTFDRVIVDRPGVGPGLLALKDARLEPVRVAGRQALHEIAFDDGRVETVAFESQTERAAARRRSQFLGRIAIALEIVGAAEGALDLAVRHARTREQFGGPIGRFQAVRHLLARASADHASLSSVADRVAALDATGPARMDEIVKALAGRNGRRICEQTLQVLGAIGFTAEHLHHHFHSRILALDSLLGTSSRLTSGLGTWLRLERPALDFASCLLSSAVD